ncbi:MAG: peptide/nickel transport system substrate-binding protein, partial [Chloroflexota bacterium]|nr:peptide/nickel transport system substrate-binding protein [Chloroflexota bacterium]
NSRAESQNPKELLDPRFRQALYRAVDRQGVSDAVTRGLAPTADSIVPPFYAVRKDVESAIVQYPYDLAAAQRALQDLGWAKAPDGVMRNAQGQEFRFLVASTAMARSQREVNSAVAGWKELGIQVDEQFDPPSLTVSDEDRVKRPGFGVPGGRADEFLTDRLSCDTVPTPATGFRGRNSGSWCNAEAQTLIDGLRTTIKPDERMQILRGLLGVIGRELPIMPMYWDLDPILVANGITGVPQPSSPSRVSTFNIAQWDKQ